MNQFTIYAPRWSTQDVLLAEWKVADRNKVVVTAKRKDGTFYYPEAFYIKGEEIRRYPIDENKMRTVPLKDLSTIPFDLRNCDHEEVLTNELKHQWCKACGETVFV